MYSSKNLWLNVKEWLMNRYNILFNFDEKTIMFGNEKYCKNINNFIVFVKLYVHNCKFKERLPHIESCMQYLNKYNYDPVK